MIIILELKNGLAKFQKTTDGRTFKLFLQDNSTIADIINCLGIPRELIAIVTINNKKSQIDSPINDGDRIAFYRPICGG